MDVETKQALVKAGATARLKAYSSPQPRRAILLVEDDPSTTLVMMKLLSWLGYEARSARSIADALRVIDDCPIDVVLSDIGLPDGDGYELMTEIRRRSNAVGIAVSGYDDQEDVERSRLAGFSNHLVKPIDFDELKVLLASFFPAVAS